jgi:monoamine oxidase
VVVLEARARVGGRVLTLRGFSEEQHAEAGGELIEDGHTSMLRLVAELGLEVVPILGKGFRLLHGRSVSEFAWSELERLFAPALHVWRLAERRWDGPVARRLGALSVAEWLERCGASDAVRATAVSLRNFFVADIEELSLLELLDQLATGGDPSQAGLFRVRGGNDRVAVALAAGLDVRLGTRLSAVHDTGSGVRLSVESSRGEASVLEADFVVLTLPAPALRDLQITPPLPLAHERALAALRYGHATKALAQFERRFWKRVGRARAWGSDGPLGALWDGNEEQAGRAGILVLLGAGGAAASLQSTLSRGGESLARELAVLGRPARLVEARTVAWHEDALSRGAYAFFDPAFDPSLRRVLAQPHGRVLFAGEHTSETSQGYMNGAVESGLRAAAEVEALHHLRTGGVEPVVHPPELRAQPYLPRQRHPMLRRRG